MQKRFSLPFNDSLLVNRTSSKLMNRKNVKAFLSFRKTLNRSNESDYATRQFDEAAIKSLIRKLSIESNNDLLTALQKKSMYTKCVCIKRTQDGRLQICTKKTWPHLLYSRIFRWPDMGKREQLLTEPTCRYSFNCTAEKLLCINPYHYQRKTDLFKVRIALTNSTDRNHLFNITQYDDEKEKETKVPSDQMEMSKHLKEITSSKFDNTHLFQNDNDSLMRTRNSPTILPPTIRLADVNISNTDHNMTTDNSSNERSLSNNQQSTTTTVPGTMMETFMDDIDQSVLAEFNMIKPTTNLFTSKIKNIFIKEKKVSSSSWDDEGEVSNDVEFSLLSSYDTPSIGVNTNDPKSGCINNEDVTMDDIMKESVDTPSTIYNDDNETMTLTPNSLVTSPQEYFDEQLTDQAIDQVFYDGNLFSNEEYAKWLQVIWYEEDDNPYHSINAGAQSIHICYDQVSPSSTIDEQIINIQNLQKKTIHQSSFGSSVRSSGKMNNLQINTNSLSVQKKFGAGIRLSKVHQDIMVEVLSDYPVFIQSVTMNIFYDLQPSTVCKVEKGAQHKLFDMETFRRLVLTCHNLNDLYVLLKLLSIRVSPVKGWGRDYPRPRILQCPFWFQLTIQGPLKWYDGLMREMRPMGSSIHSET
ncbi:hypothetical protein SNEBB_000795 [Seison nebaliae]|nr:hypothetical protein SNEBB_000795 [Seison nebaliae]